MRGRLWRLWAKSLGVKPEGLTDSDADTVALFRTLYLGIPGVCIVFNTMLGVITFGRTFGFW